MEWLFTPTHYFEESFEGEFELTRFEIREGKIVAQLAAQDYDRDPEIRRRLTDHITGLFEGVRLQSHESYELTSAGLYRDHSDGRTDVTIFPQPAEFAMSADHVDIKVSDAQGRVIKDTKQERVSEKRELASLVAAKRAKDSVVDAILASYANAVQDPANELVHLFEIREALGRRFGGQQQARKTLSISQNDWSELGRLANEEPLTQGRHRGKHPAQLRDATREELDSARAIARRMIIAYLRNVPSAAVPR